MSALRLRYIATFSEVSLNVLCETATWFELHRSQRQLSPANSPAPGVRVETALMVGSPSDDNHEVEAVEPSSSFPNGVRFDCIEFTQQ